MSKEEIKFKTFPINNTHGIYTFGHTGEFEILNLLGKGNFSKVFKAIQKGNQNSKSSKKFNCIIKIFKKNILEGNNTSAEAPKKILFFEIGEVSLLRRIKNIGNPNLIQMYDWNIDRKTCEVRILMEYVPYDLRNYFSIEPHYKNLNENLLKKIAFQILNGLNALHKNRIIHFDIKPENILFDPKTNLVKITDFSLSQYITYDTDKNVLANGGTYPYMPVEGLIDCKKYSFNYDVWSLGCILAELTCGKILFFGDDKSAVLSKINGIFGLDIKPNITYDELCKYNCKEDEKKVFINFIKKNQKITFVNDDFYDFISSFLCINPLYRINSEEALKHPWLVNSYV
jgi:serine/threonine protein kinase